MLSTYKPPAGHLASKESASRFTGDKTGRYLRYVSAVVPFVTPASVAPWPQLAWAFGGVAFPSCQRCSIKRTPERTLYPVDLLSAGGALAGRRSAADRRNPSL